MTNPSGQAPPGASAYPGMTQTFVDDFSGSSLNGSVWGSFYNKPVNQYGPWLSTHGSVSGSLAQCSIYQDSSLSNAWTGTGFSNHGQNQSIALSAGLALFMARCDGGIGVTMCLGLIGANDTPPEIDIYEDVPTTNARNQNMGVTAHWGPGYANAQYVLTNVEGLSFDATQWNVWGVEWNASTISFLLNGVVWTSFANPDANPSDPTSLVQPMAPFIQIETLDSIGGIGPGMPTGSTPSTVNMQIDWLAMYEPSNNYRLFDIGGQHMRLAHT